MNKGHNQGPQEVRRVRSPRRGEIPGVVEQILGHGYVPQDGSGEGLQKIQLPDRWTQGTGCTCNAKIP